MHLPIHPRKFWLSALLAGLSPLLVLACGARTEVLLPAEKAPPAPGPGIPDPGPVLPDPGPEMPDAAVPEEPKPDVFTADCSEIDKRSVYMLTVNFELIRFDPMDWSSSSIGFIDCPGTDQAPSSMAVNRKGSAFVVLNDGTLFEVSTTTGQCKPTGLIPNQQGLTIFGPTFTTEGIGPEEMLYAADSTGMAPTKGLFRIDPGTFAVSFVGPFSKPLGQYVELAGRGDGRLFGLFVDATSSGDKVFTYTEVDKQTGALLQAQPIPLESLSSTTSFAWAPWGGDFYVFQSVSNAPAQIFRFRPSDGSVMKVGAATDRVVGAATPTCAPL